MRKSHLDRRAIKKELKDIEIPIIIPYKKKKEKRAIIIKLRDDNENKNNILGKALIDALVKAKSSLVKEILTNESRSSIIENNFRGKT
jgi:hypothetical protein